MTLRMFTHWKNILCSICLVWPLALLAATPAAPASASASAPPAAKPAPPLPPPTPVPAEVDPFADDANLPPPLKWPSAARPRLDMSVHNIMFDGMQLTVMTVKGPDFEWQFNPLHDFIPALVSNDESLAFTYVTNPGVRLSLALFADGELLPDFTPASLAQYLACFRSPAPKNFILLTPFPKDATGIQAQAIGGFHGQVVDYAIVTETGIEMHHDFFVDLNHEYLLLVRLSGPQGLVERLAPVSQAFINNSRIMKGLGVKEEKPAPAKPASTTNADG